MLATRSAANTGIADADWDSALQEAGGHFLQSTAWQRVQQALGYTVVWARGDGWMCAAKDAAKPAKVERGNRKP